MRRIWPSFAAAAMGFCAYYAANRGPIFRIGTGRADSDRHPRALTRGSIILRKNFSEQDEWPGRAHDGAEAGQGGGLTATVCARSCEWWPCAPPVIPAERAAREPG